MSICQIPVVGVLPWLCDAISERQACSQWKGIAEDFEYRATFELPEPSFAHCRDHSGVLQNDKCEQLDCGGLAELDVRKSIFVFLFARLKKRE